MAVDLGTNLNWVNDWDPEKLSADLIWQGRHWAVGDGNGSNAPNRVGIYAGTSLDAQGWPIVPAGTAFGTVIEYGPWLGTYKLSFKTRSGVSGANTVSNYGAGSYTFSNWQWNNVTNVTSCDLTVNAPWASSNIIWLRWNQAGSTGITDVHLMRPLKTGVGNHTIGTPLSDYIIDRLAWFSTIRVMQMAGGSSGLSGGIDTTWASRTRPTGPQTVGGDVNNNGGVAWENIIAAANQAQKHVWVCVPFYANDDYILKMAQAFRYGTDGVYPYTSYQASPEYAPLAANLNLYVEHGNEIWNSGPGYPANANYNLNNAEIAAGDPNKTTYKTSDSTEWGYSWRRTGWLAVRQSLIFRSVFGDAAMMTRVRPVLATQHGRYSTTDEPLNYIRDVWGPSNAYNSGATFNTINGVTNPRQPQSYYIYGLATAPYVPAGQNFDATSTVTILDHTIADMNKTAAGEVTPAMTWNKGRATTHGVQYLAYEGGSNLFATMAIGGDNPTTRQNIKDATYDPVLGARMGANLSNGVPLADQSNHVYGKLFTSWTAAGGGLYCHFTLGENFGAESTFGLCPPSAQSGSDPRLETGPKWDAVKAFAVLNTDPPPPPPVTPQDHAPLGRGASIGSNRHWRL